MPLLSPPSRSCNGQYAEPSKNWGTVYRDKERKFRKETDPEKDGWAFWGLNRLRNSGTSSSRLATMCRIADDDVALISVFCASCIEKMGAQVYPEPLKHSSDPGGTYVQAVDVAIELNGPVYKITRLNKNSKYSC